MAMVSNEMICTLSKDVYGYVISELKKPRCTVCERALLAETYLCLEMLQNSLTLPADEYVILNRVCKKIHKHLWNNSIFYFSSFYYLKSAVNRKTEPEIQRDFQKLNVDIMAMNLHIREAANARIDLGFSEDDCFFERITMCNSAFLIILRNKRSELYDPVLYCMCNLLQTLFLYHSKINGKYQKQAADCTRLLMETLKKYSLSSTWQENLNNPQLACFLLEQQEQYNGIYPDHQRFVPQPIITSQQPPRTILRALTNMTSPLMQPLFQELWQQICTPYFSEADGFGILEKTLYLRNALFYLKITEQERRPLTLGISEYMPHFDLNAFLNQVFQLDQIDLNAVTLESMDMVTHMRDDELRRKVANTIQGVRLEVLQRESTKPHGSFEISDMELRIDYQGSSIFLCMPFKSGVEIQGQTVPVNITYQIIRPFTEFDHCVVVFITAKRCSENLMNQIKKLQDRCNWPIAVIEERCLAALLLHHKQL